MLTIVQTALEVHNLKNFCQAVHVAGLANVLSKEGPFTVFAPNDNAFSNLPEAMLETFLQDIPRLRDILSYHVIPGGMMCSDICRQSSLITLEGEQLHIDAKKGCKVNSAIVVQPDIRAANGIIHAIDAVLMPKYAHA